MRGECLQRARRDPSAQPPRDARLPEGAAGLRQSDVLLEAPDLSHEGAIRGKQSGETFAPFLET